MDKNCQVLNAYLTTPKMRKIRENLVASLDGNPHEPCVYYVLHLANLLRICNTPGILPRAAINDAVGDLAGQQVQERRAHVDLILGARHEEVATIVERALHSCVNFFWNPNNSTTRAFQIRALHQAAEFNDENLECICFLELPLSCFSESVDYHWCTSRRNLASSDVSQKYSSKVAIFC